ncbi:MAG TPA: hypothetical protein VJZ31_01685 [Bacilli bacterium]|nr:hypothetical protein [Bacilli bacterium]
MSKRLYFDYSYEIAAAFLFSSRWLFLTSKDGEHHKLLNRHIDYHAEMKPKEYLNLLLKLDDQKTIENNLYNLTYFYKNNAFLLTDATLFALGEFSRTNTLLPTQGDWANTSDGFLHLIGYFLYAYTKEGHYILERKEVLETIEKITHFTHSNMRVLISHTLLFALMTKLLESRLNNNGRALSKKQIWTAVDEAIRKVLYQYRDYQYLGDLRYFVRLDKQLYDHASTVAPSSQISKINPKELRAGNYVIDTIETLLFTLLKVQKYEDGLKFIADIPGFHPINGVLFTILYTLAHGLPPQIRASVPRVVIEEDANLNVYLTKYYKRAFKPIKAIVNRIGGEEIFESEQLANFASQIEFEFERLGIFIKVPLFKIKEIETSYQAYYQLYLLVKATKRFDSIFVGQIILIKNVINTET